jgi:hypothetical protein
LAALRLHGHAQEVFMTKSKTPGADASTKAPETQKDVFRGAHRAKDGVPSDREVASRDGGNSEGQPTDAPGAGFPDPDEA